MNDQSELKYLGNLEEALLEFKNGAHPIFVEHLGKHYRINEVVELFPPTPSHEESIKGSVVVIRTGEEAPI